MFENRLGETSRASSGAAAFRVFGPESPLRREAESRARSRPVPLPPTPANAGQLSRCAGVFFQVSCHAVCFVSGDEAELCGRPHGLLLSGAAVFFFQALLQFFNFVKISMWAEAPLPPLVFKTADRLSRFRRRHQTEKCVHTTNQMPRPIESGSAL